MNLITVAKGEKFIQKGDHLSRIYLLVRGTVRVTNNRDAWDMEAGSFIGFTCCNSDTYVCDYTASEECKMYAYEYQGPSDFVKIFKEDEKYVSVFVMAAMRHTHLTLARFRKVYQQARAYYAFLMKANEEYAGYCGSYRVSAHPFERMEIAAPYVPKYRIDDCVALFYQQFSSMSLKGVEETLKRNTALCVGEILNAVEWTAKAMEMIEEMLAHLEPQKELLINSRDDDLYHRYFELAVKASAEGAGIVPLQEAIGQIQSFAKGCGLYEASWLEQAFAAYEKHDFTSRGGAGAADSFAQEDTDYLKQILDFAEYGQTKALKEDLKEYRALTDLYASTDDVRALRRRLTKSFFEIYTECFRKAVNGAHVPVSVMMLLNFGFLDPELAGEDVTKSLHMMAERLNVCSSENVYTIYEWLKSIYMGKNEPSKNEFDMDYQAFLIEEKKSGRISAKDEQQLLGDKWKKALFEIENMFMANNRMTYGKITTYCPVLREEDIINSVENMLVTAAKVQEAFNCIKSVDFSIFYRQVVFSDSAHDMNTELIQKEVMPLVILMPNAGSRAMMWQETSGIKRDTPARFIFPVMTVSSVTEMMIEAAGRYRWEICRKIQGVRWNDVTEPSLTSEYSDYIQYYRKNHELSADAKEKVKNALQKSKNNFREVFVRDYQNWINYEAKGSFRLNKVSREILFRYCPFTRNIRQELKINPMYRDMFEKYEGSLQKTKRRIDNLYDRYKKNGGQITKELQCNRDFYDM